jgi:heme exporter protein A
MRLTATGVASERGDRLIFEGVSFSVADGELLSLTGPNGAGKSTLLRIVAGLLPMAEGKVTLDPEVDGPRGMVMHYLGHRDALKQALTVRENLAFWRKLAANPEGLTPLDALDVVKLPHLIDLPASVLSAGQRRRVSIARLLVDPRPIWLLDEPTAALDAASERDLGNLIANHLKGGGIALAATHLPLPVPATATLRLGSAA